MSGHSGYILALDQGTTSSRAIIYDDKGQVVQIAQQATTLLTPKAGFVEQDAEQIWQTQISCAFDAISTAGLLATDITSIGITNQRETIIVWDKATGKPLAPAIIWQDRRSESWCKDLRQQAVPAKHVTDSVRDMQSHISSITGLRIDPYFSAGKIVWLLDNMPMLRERAESGEICVGTVDSWLIFKLTGGEHVTDATNASRTLLYDIYKRKWSSRLCEQFNIPSDILPKVMASDADFGKTKKGLFAKQIPIQAVLGDQQASLFGQDCLQTGMAKNTYGTGCFMLMNIGEEPRTSQHHLLTTIAWQQKSANKTQSETPKFEGIKTSNSLGKWMQSGKRVLPNQLSAKLPAQRETTYALEGSVFMAGAIVQWLRDNLGLFDRSQDVETLAKSVDDSDSVVLVPAFTGLGAPYWRSDVSASIMGLTRGTTKAHIARAALEAIAFQTYDVLNAMQKDSPKPLTELRVDGGASQNDLLMQFQADLLGVPVLRPKDVESTAKGVAILAGLKCGLYDKEIWQASWQLDTEFNPQLSHDEREALLGKWHRAVQQTLNQST